MGELRSAQDIASSSEPQDVTVDDTPKGLMSRFYTLQEERVQTYHMFEEGFLAYLNGAPNYNFPLYRQLVHQITQTFNNISAEVLSIKEKFASQNNWLSLAQIIEKIQEAEKTKLELTAKFQLCRQKQQDEPSEEVESEVDNLKQQLRENRDYLIEQMEELKYESEDLYTEESEVQPTHSESSGSAER